ncbi:MAG: hypothetical protein EA375_00075 [Acholeplasmataceae bacterium]|nr:MAG: hypothetical protein EA375_00075 [Acholeplasmataceae bacterium]
MKHLIIITGQLATFKSTTARQLGEDLAIPCLNKDDIKELLGDIIGYQNRAENLNLSKATFALMFHVARRVFMAHDAMILESNFRDHEFETLKDHAKTDGIRLITVFMTGDPKVLLARYLEREPTRHHVHTSTNLKTMTDYQNAMRAFDETLYGPDTIIVDTTDPASFDYERLLSDLKERLS